MSRSRGDPFPSGESRLSKKGQPVSHPSSPGGGLLRGRNEMNLSCRPLQMPLLTMGLGLCLMILICCGGGGGGGSSPTEPSAPLASVQGTWVGNATSVSASGTCLADNFGSATVPARWVIQQNGTAFTGRQTLNNIVTCNFRGTVNGATATFFPETGGSPFCTVQTTACRSAPRRTLRMELRIDRAILVATVAGDRMSASGTAVWRVTDTQTGQFIGDYEVRATQELQRQ